MGQGQTIRHHGRRYEVIDRLRLGRKDYLLLERLQGGRRAGYLAYDQYASPEGELRVIRTLDRSPEAEQHVAVLKRATQSNSNVPPILEYYPDGDRLYLVLPWIEGRDLQSYLDEVKSGRSRRPSAVEAFKRVRGLAHGLCQFHHRQNLVHGDLKPANLILAGERRALVMIDFGSSWTAERTAARLEGDGVSELYAAPERQAEEPLVDFRSDQFSVSVILYELLTLQLPYGGLGGRAGRPEYRDAAADKYVPPSRLNREGRRLPGWFWKRLNRIVATGLALDPANRYPNRRAWLDELDDLNAETRRLSRLSLPNRLIVGFLDKLVGLWPFAAR